MNFVRITYQSCFEVSVNDQVDDTCEEEEDDLNETSHVAEELEHTPDRSGVHSLCGVRTKINLYVTHFVCIKWLIMLVAIIKFEDFNLVRSSKELERIVISYQLAFLIEEVELLRELAVDPEEA